MCRKQHRNRVSSNPVSSNSSTLCPSTSLNNIQEEKQVLLVEEADSPSKRVKLKSQEAGGGGNEVLREYS